MNILNLFVLTGKFGREFRVRFNNNISDWKASSNIVCCVFNHNPLLLFDIVWKMLTAIHAMGNIYPLYPPSILGAQMFRVRDV